MYIKNLYCQLRFSDFQQPLGLKMNPYNKNDSIEIWLDSVQKKRNAIHSFNSRNIGTANDFYDDLETLYDFINQIEIRLPALEGYNDDASFTIGYQVPYLPFDRKAIIRV